MVAVSLKKNSTHSPYGVSYSFFKVDPPFATWGTLELRDERRSSVAMGLSPYGCERMVAELLLVWSVFDPGPNPHRGPRTRLMF